MLRPAWRAVVRVLPTPALAQHRLASTAPRTNKARSWKGLLARCGIAAGAIYYYNTSDAFAGEPARFITPQAAVNDHHEPEQPPTLESVVAERKKSAEAEAAADQEGAFNPETGEINWDCPCLGGMAHGPCGDEFRAAFSCFVYSKEEPKGMDCIDRFKGMQDCFRKYPDIYGEELDGDDEQNAAPEGVDAPVAQDLPGASATPATEAPKAVAVES